jgi:ubiquinone/menaquinone biosynthesis C-methylase UbiE
MKKTATAGKRPPTPESFILCEIDFVEGLLPFAAEEISARFQRKAQIIDQTDASLTFRYAGDIRTLNKLRSVQAAYTVEQYAIPRPKALLGDAYWRRFMAQIRHILDVLPPNTFRSFSLSAAGTESTVMQRIRQEIAATTGLPEAEKGDLWIRIRSNGKEWQTLVRTSARPNTTRTWRVCNYEASLNASVAHAMAKLIATESLSPVINLGCGSGSLLIEYRAIHAERRLIGIDHDPTLLKCAAQNIAAEGAGDITLLQGDLRRMPFPSQSFDALTADLPFGQNVGSHEDNVRLYPQILHEAARIAQHNAVFVCITHEISLLEGLLASQHAWRIEQTLRVTLRGLHPRIYMLRRTSHTH